MKDRSANSSASSSNSKSGSAGKEKSSNSASEAKTSLKFEGLTPGPEVGVLLIDESRKIVTANDVSAAIFGTSDLAGKDINVLLKGGLQNEFGRILQQKFQPGKGTQRFVFEVEALCKGGPAFPVSVILTRNSVSNKTWWTALFRKLEGEERDHDQDAILQGATDELQKHCLSMVEETTSYREELVAVQKERDELFANLELNKHAVADLERKMAEQITRNQELETSLVAAQKELNEVQTGTAMMEKDVESEIAQNERLKEELVALRQMCDDLTEQLASEQLVSTESSKRAEELQQQFEKANQTESEWRARLEESHQEAQKLKNEREREELITREMAAELDGLRHTLQESESKRIADQQSAEQSTQRLGQLESELLSKNQELEKAQSELAKGNLEGSQEEWIQDLRRLRELEATFESDRTDLEHRVREGMTALAKATTDLDRERKDRRRIEQRSSSLTTQLQEMHEELKRHLESERSSQDRIYQLEENLREREELVGRLQTQLRDEEAGHQLAEEQLNLAGDMKAQVDNYRTLFEESKDTFKRSREELEAKLQSTLQSLNESEKKLRQEMGNRQRLEQSLAKVQEDLDRSALELSNLQSEFQVERLERKQLEGDAAHSRYATLDSARVNRAQTSTLKRQLREPVETLMQTSRTLLDADLPGDQKKLVETLLENTFLVQACLQEGSAGTGAVPAVAPVEHEVPLDSPQEDVNGAVDDASKAA